MATVLATRGLNIPAHDEIILEDYNANGDPATITYSLGGVTVAALIFTYDGNGNCIGVVRTDGSPSWSFNINTEAVTPGVSTFSLITNNPATVNVKLDWGDGQKQSITIGTGTVTTSHTYAVPGSYTVTLSGLSGAIRPYYNNNAEVKKITALNGSLLDYSFGTTLQGAWWGGSNISSIDAGLDTSGVTNFTTAWYGCSSLTSFPLINTAAGTSFNAAWFGCSSLTSFPLIDTSLGTNFSSTWQGCSSLTSFPLIDTSAGTNFASAWQLCSSLTSFPLIDTSAGTGFGQAWSGCSSLTSFPLIDVSAGTFFNAAWQNCSSLTDFPAGFFDSWAATPSLFCFASAWSGCTSLTATSVENILNSIATSGVSAPFAVPDITIDYNASSGTPNIGAAVTTLKSRGWTITLNGVLQ